MRHDYKANERKYFERLTPEDRRWVKTKPFGRLEESGRRIKDFAFILEIFDLPVGAKILDIGAGSGWTSIWLAQMNYQVTATDISAAMIEVGKVKARRLKLNNLKFIVADSEKLDFDSQFDAVLIYDTLHHCQRENRVLSGAFRALRPGGKILIVEPNSAHGWDTDAQAKAKRYGILEKGYSPRYLQATLAEIGFQKITRFYAGGQVVRAYASGFWGGIKHVLVPWAARLVYGRYKSAVWLRAVRLG